jgi:hypothetical protein
MYTGCGKTRVWVEIDLMPKSRYGKQQCMFTGDGGV